ncbi:hypothetical protein OsJ_15392 [Oryza sativa Japonica Group]|uniref:Uncharacterized protein n=1 Tax=Oryza sativa subsp. japonica TaxID=39947 RepID=B9FG17_ORYSJ|nr:hypothetical protein OsJ_15392 [Oryza sativa Japonica Group]
MDVSWQVNPGRLWWCAARVGYRARELGPGRRGVDGDLDERGCTLYSANRGRAQTPDRRAVASRSNIDRPSPHTSRERTTPKLRPEARAEGFINVVIL